MIMMDTVMVLMTLILAWSSASKTSGSSDHAAFKRNGSEHRPQYEANLVRFLDQLDTTDQSIAKQLAAVKSKSYYVFHDAYAYFEQHYGLNNIGHFTVSPERKPGAKTLISIRRSLTDNQAKCVFSEPQFQPAVIETVVRGSNVHIGVLDPLGSNIPVQSGVILSFYTSYRIVL